MDIDTVVYESQNPIKPEEKFCVFIVVEANEIDGKKRTGRKIKDRMSVVFWGTSSDDARQKALNFWENETRKARERSERYKRLGESKRKNT